MGIQIDSNDIEEILNAVECKQKPFGPGQDAIVEVREKLRRLVSMERDKMLKKLQESITK